MRPDAIAASIVFADAWTSLETELLKDGWKLIRFEVHPSESYDIAVFKGGDYRVAVGRDPDETLSRLACELESKP